MLVSWNWLKDYVLLDMPAAELERRLMLAGLNHESTVEVGGDLAIDLEVTSNRPDCLGHIGVAREVAVLWQREHKVPAAEPPEAGRPVDDLAKVRLTAPDLCHRFTARVIQGVQVADSPLWLRRRLTTLGIACINNVVDITNYVLMECGQPLHAYDLAQVQGRALFVRDAQPNEPFCAINHKTYTLQPGMCVIADDRRAIGLGGVMGGSDTEIAPTTTELLIEAAEFFPSAIRKTARALNLHSDSSYRFERGVDAEAVDWASRRCCELILQLAGGTLAIGRIDEGRQPGPRSSIVLRLSQLKRILGIEIDPQTVRRILADLGNQQRHADAQTIEVVPPSWRRDLTREIDLVEEVGRIYGYDAIPEDVKVPMATSARTDADRVLCTVRRVMTAAGFNEALTLSLVEQEWSELFTPWTSAPALQSAMPVLRRANQLRRSLIPSLLSARRMNETLANDEIELFEIARGYLANPAELPTEELLLALTSGADFFQVKGVLEALVSELNPAATLEAVDTSHRFFGPRSAELLLAGETLGFVGQVAPEVLKHFELRGSTTVAELKLSRLIPVAQLVAKYRPLPSFPATSRDINLVVDEAVRWVQVAEIVHAHGGKQMESLAYVETYRSPQLGPGKKSLLLTLRFRSEHGTLMGEEVDGLRDQVVAACAKKLGAALRA